MKKLIVFPLIIFALGLIAQPIEIRITEVPYEPPPIVFNRVHFDIGGKQTCETDSIGTVRNARSQIGFGFGVISTRDSDIQLESRFSYRKVDLSNLNIPGVAKHQDFTILVGGRYFPRYPTFGLSKSTPVRMTFAAIGGLNMRGQGFADQMAFDMILNAGIVISQSDNPSGVMFEFQYRPITSDAIPGVILLPSYTFAISWLFGPG